MTKTSKLIPGLAGLLLLATACSGQSTSSGSTADARGVAAPGEKGPGLSTVLFLGDSVAVSEAVPLTEAFAASNVRFQSLAAEGGGNVVGPFSDKNWEKLPAQIAAAKPSVVIYQTSTYDWGSKQAQRTAYRKLLTTVTDVGAKLVLVTGPPIKPDDFYKPHMAELERALSNVRAIAEESAGKATALDSTAVWGSTYQRSKDGKVDRSSDGIHPCPQGAARFTNWLLDELAKQFPGFTPADPQAWANTGWSSDKHFVGC